MASRGRNYDLSVADFTALLTSVYAKCQTPDQQERAQKARNLYGGTGGYGLVGLLVVPALPPLVAGSGGNTTEQVGGASQFRLRGTSSLFTYNSPSFVGADRGDLWTEFLASVRRGSQEERRAHSKVSAMSLTAVSFLAR